MEYDTITLEEDGYEVEIPVLEGRILLRAFVEELEENLVEKGNQNHERSNAIATLVEDSNLLDEAEMTELVGENREEAGKSRGTQRAITTAWETLNGFMEDL